MECALAICYGKLFAVLSPSGNVYPSAFFESKRQTFMKGIPMVKTFPY